jgi:hypothetical protein
MGTIFRGYNMPELTVVDKIGTAVALTGLVLLASIFAGCAARAQRTTDPFAAAAVPGWHRVGAVEHYGADDMYLKIDGAADAYLRFNARGLTFATYARDDRADHVVEVYSYQMTSPADARAAYESERPADATAVAVGDRGYRSGGTVFFCRGTSYVRLIPMRSDETDAPAILDIARAWAEQIGS